MHEESRQSPRIYAAARGVATVLETHHNSAGNPWVTFTLETAGGSLPCMCFPRSLESVGVDIEWPGTFIVLGQVTRGENLEMRALQIERPPA